MHKIVRIEVDPETSTVDDVAFFFSDDPNLAYYAFEFEEGTSTRLLLNGIQEAIWHINGRKE